MAARNIPLPVRPTIVHLTASPCFGGVERQMLELGCELQGAYRSVFATFREEGRCGDFVARAADRGVDVYALRHDFPQIVGALLELLTFVRNVRGDLICSHGYKANLFGLLVARRLGIPAISVSHGWTGESRMVRAYEALDRLLLRRMDRVVCVSAAQADKVRAAGVPTDKVTVIHDGVRTERFYDREPVHRAGLEAMFDVKPRLIVGAAGRLSPEKGFTHFVTAAKLITEARNDVGCVLFGDGPLRRDLERQAEALGLRGRFHFAGFCSNLDQYFPQLDVFVLPSYTEGLPNVVLEAFAAGVPVVATAVGGTPEVVRDGVSGYLVSAGDATTLAARIEDLADDDERRLMMGYRGAQRVRNEFSFEQQACDYSRLIDSLLGRPRYQTASDQARAVNSIAH